MFKIDKEMQNVILKNPINGEIYKVARKDGMLMMKEDAMFKAIRWYYSILQKFIILVMKMNKIWYSSRENVLL